MSAIVEIDLNECLPGWGENCLVVQSSDGNLNIEVFYDGGSGSEETRILIFSRYSFYSVGSFPGVSSLAHEYDANFYNTGCVVRVQSSELSVDWKKHWEASGLNRNCNHYMIFWGAENKVVHVIAENVEMSTL